MFDVHSNVVEYVDAFSVTPSTYRRIRTHGRAQGVSIKDAYM